MTKRRCNSSTIFCNRMQFEKPLASSIRPVYTSSFCPVYVQCSSKTSPSAEIAVRRENDLCVELYYSVLWMWRKGLISHSNYFLQFGLLWRGSDFILLIITFFSTGISWNFHTTRFPKALGTYGHGSIPINTIFRGMTIHLAILMWTTGVQGFDTLPYVPNGCSSH
jgi:hypothetical protein